MVVILLIICHKKLLHLFVVLNLQYLCNCVYTYVNMNDKREDFMHFFRLRREVFDSKNVNFCLFLYLSLLRWGGWLILIGIQALIQCHKWRTICSLPVAFQINNFGFNILIFWLSFVWYLPYNLAPKYNPLLSLNLSTFILFSKLLNNVIGSNDFLVI